MTSALTEWHEKDFNDFITSKQTGIVEFGAPWCAACKISEPIIAETSKEYDKITFAKIDVSKNPGIASKMGVMSLPNILVIREGKVIDQIIGTVNQKSLDEKIKKLVQKY